MKQYKVNTMQWSKTKSKATHKYAIKQGTRWPQPVRGCHWMKSKVVRMYGLWDCVVRLLYECLFSLPLLLPTSDTWISPLGPVLLQARSSCSSRFLLWTWKSGFSQLTGDPVAHCTLLSLPWNISPLCWPGGGRQSEATAQSPHSSSARRSSALCLSQKHSISQELNLCCWPHLLVEPNSISDRSNANFSLAHFLRHSCR